MYLVEVKLSVDGRISHLRYWENDLKKCHEYLDTFPSYLIVDWSISPFLIQDPIESYKPIKQPKVCSVKISLGDEVRSFYGVHPHNLGDLFKGLDLSRLSHVKISCYEPS